ncbi:neuferricin homolog [Bombyx mori]|uniref:Cytochrome b5 heme-binding domain-containing protein n=1 Tax=Bombyx mori TaxID=7091 RepID=A0A8R2GBB2_BOMMO|nr:neuferricin homolog [Bombyx mori]
MKRYSKFILAIVIVLGGVYYRNELDIYLSSFIRILYNENVNNNNVFTYDELARYNGIENAKLYLAVLGTIYDVTKGEKHYAKGATYHYFVGKDGSRGLITGDFRDETKEKDHVLDLKCSDLSALLHWKQTFKQKYTEIGLLKGRYYDSQGRETPYLENFNRKIEQCNEEKEIAKKKNQEYPPCNIAWSEEEGTKVWCTKNSGGIARSWIGVPRQMYSPGEDTPSCVCVNTEKHHTALLKEYSNCVNTSTVCMTNI